MSANKVFGIDLGTTYSCISQVDRYGRPEVISNMDGDATTPSVVQFQGDDVIVGKLAKRSSRLDPDNVAQLVKRHIGESDWRFHAGGREWSASGVSSLILGALAKDAERATGERVDDVVITVPAYFGNEERKQTRLAGELAGLNVLDLINEPTAAAYAYGFAQEGAANESILVYDLGGGTFDITIIALEGSGSGSWPPTATTSSAAPTGTPSWPACSASASWSSARTRPTRSTTSTPRPTC